MKLLLAKLVGFFINLIAFISPNYAARLAIRLFSTPLKGKLTEEAQDFMDKAYQEEVIVNGNPIMTYRWLGKKETILLVHGWESNSFRWKDLIESLKAKDFNIVALDAPAHGRSGGHVFNAIDYADCIHFVAKKFKAQTIIGHSVGGMATILFQHEHQLPFVKRIVLLGAPSNYNIVFKRYTSMMSFRKPLVKSINEFALKQFGNLPQYYDSAEFSKNLDIKGLIIHDVEDNIIPYSEALNYQEHYSNAKLISTKNLDHSLKSEDVDQYILDFVSS